jgi:hypothetical protein
MERNNNADHTIHKHETTYPGREAQVKPAKYTENKPTVTQTNAIESDEIPDPLSNKIWMEERTPDEI